MERAHPGYLHYYFVERHLQGYLTATQRHAGRPFWYYLPIVARRHAAVDRIPRRALVQLALSAGLGCGWSCGAGSRSASCS